MAHPGINPPNPPTPEVRLESWKEIASYLKRSVRTVQEWEKKEALPVHRHLHDKLGSIYAYKAELDTWWRNGHERLEKQEQEEPPEQVAARPQRLRWALVAAALGLAAVAAGIGLWWLRGPVLPFEERDWVLIAQFENRTGEEVFNGTLEHALERELSTSRFVNVVPRERANDTLLLMRKPLDTPISAAVGREVCLRDGDIRALLTGRVEKLDSTYLLSVALVNPGSGVTVRSFSEEAAGQKQVVSVLRRLSSQVREALGEALPEIRKSEQALEKATTPSLRALQLFSRGRALLEPPSPQNQWPVAAEFFEQATAEDPEFASAHVWLAYAYLNLKRPEEGLPHFQRAFELADTTTDPERYFIVGSYHWQHSKDLPKAAQAFEALLQIHPDHVWATQKLHWIYQRMGDGEKALALSVRYADLRPNDFLSNAQAAQSLVENRADLTQAKPYYERAQALLTPEMIQRFPWWTAWVETYPAWEHLGKGEMAKALDELARLEKRIEEGAGDFYLAEIGKAYLEVGKLKKSEELFALLKRDSERYYFTSWVDYARGDWKSLRDHRKLIAERTAYGPRDVELFARAGLLAEARRAVSGMEASKRPEGYLALARGYLAQAEGRTDEAIRLFEKARQDSEPQHLWQSMQASAALARIREKQGNLDQAIELLESIRGHRDRAFLSGTGFDWIESQMHLAKLFRRVGRQREAAEIEDELRKLLVYADADHAIARELRQGQQAALTQPTK